MVGKERVSLILEHKIPDRVPWGEYAIDYDTVEKILGHETYLRAKAKTQIAFWEVRRDEVAQSWREDLIELYRKLDFIDIINLAAMCTAILPPKDYIPEKPKRIDENTWEFEEGRIYKYSSVTGDITLVYDPQKWTREFKLEDFKYEEPLPPDESRFEVLDVVIEEFKDEKFILGPDGGEVSLLLLGDMERGLIEYIENPEVVKRAIDVALYRANKLDKFYIREGQDGVMWGTDFASNKGPFISPRMFREFCLPAIKERVRNVKGFGMKVMKHACGNNTQLMDIFVEAGYDAYQSIQETAGMDLKWLKDKYGDKLVLWGGVNVENLVSGTPEDVKRDVKKAMEILKPDGGYIFGTSHTIAVGTKYDNFMAMVDEYLRLCDY
ncbi:MAG TPA: uroporphyrinogen decarboxylase family protein [bacterium]|nr:uroporphyrinogen decarboxylase family protein [bacterium]